MTLAPAVNIIVHEHLREDITKIRRKSKQTTVVNIDFFFFFKDARKQLEKLNSSNFSVIIHFHPSHLQPDNFSTYISIVNKNVPLYLGFPRKKYITLIS